MALLLLLGLLLQNAGPAQPPQPPAPPSESAIQSLLNDAEARALQRSSNLPARIQALLNAAGRYLKAADKSLKEDDAAGIQSALSAYGQILKSCEWQMHSHKPGKAPNLKKQEITLRKYIATLEDMWAKADLDYKQWFKEANQTSIFLRVHFLQTFFGTQSLKRP